MTNRDLRIMAWSKLSGHWMKPILATLIYVAISAVISYIPYIGYLSVLIIAPLSVGYSYFFLSFSRGNDPEFDTLFFGFKNAFVTSIIAYFLMIILIFAWSLLLIIPGIIKSFAYSQFAFIIADNPGIQPMEALHQSEDIMRGHKLDLFFLQLSFIGWILLVLITFGIAAIWVVPYMQAATAEFYRSITDEVDSEESKPEDDYFTKEIE